MLDKEIWRDVVGYEGLYAVSNLGNVCSWHKCKPKMLSLIDIRGYKFVGLHKDKHRYMCGVHRLVATAFIPNPNFMPMVNHKDENPSNNTPDNLEWCDAKYNINYGTRTERVSKKAIMREGKAVLQLKDGVVIAEYDCIRSAAKNTGLLKRKISDVCHHRDGRQMHGGFGWKFKEAS